MLSLYILITSLLYPFVPAAGMFSKKARSFLSLRKEDRKKIEEFKLETKGRVLWLHAASVGELDQCKALAKEIKTRENDAVIIQSIFSESVQEKNFDTVHTALTFRLPLDFYFSYDFIFEKFKPETLVLMAWDTWPNLILSAKRHGCKVYLACAVLDPKSGRNSGFARKLTKAVFSLLDGISPVDEKLVSEFAGLSGLKVKVQSTGDTRFDSVVQKIKEKEPDSRFKEFIRQYTNEKRIILGSTYADCDSILFKGLETLLKDGYSVWIFPHKINPERIEEIKKGLTERGLQFSLYSDSKMDYNANIIIFDVLGVLAFAYAYANLAYIGGAVHNKIHNVLEPAYFGLPLITGEKITNSFDAMKLKEAGGLITIKTTDEFLNAFSHLTDPGKFPGIRKMNSGYVASKTGASGRFYDSFLKK